MSTRALSPQLARRLALAAQYLAAERPAPDAEGIYQVVRQLGCLQLDPISVVARSHQLVLWSRVGAYNLAELDKLLWQERRLFEYWAHEASIVLTEEYPVHYAMMSSYMNGDSAWSQRTQAWIAENDSLRRHILDAIAERGALGSKHFEDKAADEWYSTGWTSGRNVSKMLDVLWIRGALMVAARKGGQKVWDLAERCLPDWTPREEWTPEQVTRYAAQKAIRALGVANARHIQQHYTRRRYPGLNEVLRALEREGRIERVRIAGEGRKWQGDWYVHADDLPLLERLEAGEWQPRATLLSPFDNLICDRARTELLFDFRFRIEIYVPKEKREYGYYVLPILHGDRLIGRIDPTMNRKTGTLVVNNVYAEPDAPTDRQTGRAVARAVEALAAFLGATTIDYAGQTPQGWKLGG